MCIFEVVDDVLRLFSKHFTDNAIDRLFHLVFVFYLRCVPLCAVCVDQMPV